ncbi:hypothetical protein BST92_12335 [Nonlabens arenilitoris]|uniref:Uncharacterized protein n=1 Tax=Nonlabens arenilitoris TaxID=1217969 RepID=A0A2S7UCJ4_9FLAO|nr:hypothetical protein [Nonlabens arenilitoris]PQJ32668.1 hypothetical protein BST92_12335 [Nonlabens arenilitoris]
MIHSTIRLVSLIILCLLIYSCSDSNYKQETQNYVLEYNTGQKYCEGNFIIYSNNEKTFRKRDGIWKFYELNGEPMRIEEYNLDDLISYKEFNENGKVGMSQIWTSTSHNYSKYYYNGNLKYEEITTLISEDEYAENYEGQTLHYETEIEHITIKEYHLNGQLKLIDKRHDGYSEEKIKFMTIKETLF